MIEIIIEFPDDIVIQLPLCSITSLHAYLTAFNKTPSFSRATTWRIKVRSSSSAAASTSANFGPSTIEHSKRPEQQTMSV
jgi:hypothetical protein